MTEPVVIHWEAKSKLFKTIESVTFAFPEKFTTEEVVVVSPVAFGKFVHDAAFGQATFTAVLEYTGDVEVA